MSEVFYRVYQRATESIWRVSLMAYLGHVSGCGYLEGFGGCRRLFEGVLQGN